MGSTPLLRAISRPCSSGVMGSNSVAKSRSMRYSSGSPAGTVAVTSCESVNRRASRAISRSATGSYQQLGNCCL